MSTQERCLAWVVGFEVIALAYLALVAFLTPTPTHQHDVVASMVLLALGAPLLWSAAVTVLGRRERDVLALRLLIPNAVLLVAFADGALVGGRAQGSLLAGMVECALLGMVVASLLLGRRRLRRSHRMTGI